MELLKKAEREKFEARRGEFSDFIQKLYDEAHTFHDGKWMLIRVDNLVMLEAVKKIVLIKKNPNRKPFLKTRLHSGNCGHRCDLCVHFKGQATFSDEEMNYARECCKAIYGDGDWQKNCDGCHFPNCSVESADCRKCKGIKKCTDFGNFAVCAKTAGWPPKIYLRTITADQVTYAILPYVKGQYEN